MAVETEKFITPLIAIFVGVALIPAVTNYVTSANITDPATRSLVLLIPFFYGLSVFLYTIRGVVF